MKKEMLINVLQPEETRIAILEDGVLEELYVERVSNESFVGNIYKGRIVNIEPSIQAAFVDFGVGRNGFLHISDVDPIYYEKYDSLEQLYTTSERRTKGKSSRRPERGRKAEPEAEQEQEKEQEEPVSRAKPRREEDDSRRRGKSGGRRRGRRRRDEEPIDADVPQELSVSSEALPDLDDFQISEDDDAFGAGIVDVDDMETDSGLIEPEEETVPEKAEPIARQQPAARPAPPAAPQQDEEDDEDDSFGAGILDDDEDDDGPRVQDQPGYYRKTELNDDEDDDDDGFGSGLFDEDDSEDEAPSVAIGQESSNSEDQEDRPKRRRRRGRRRRRKDAPEEKTEEQPATSTAVEELQPQEVEVEDQPDDDEEDSIFATSLDEEIEEEEDQERRRRRGNGRRNHKDRNGSRGGSSRRPRQRPPIQEVFRRGQEVLVQVIKEGIGNKGPTLSTYVSIPGRYLVLMPGLNRVGVSRKIVDEESRRRLRDIVVELERPDNVGFIIRTAGLDRTPKELERDLNYLVRLWDVVLRRIREQRTPAVIYQESDMIIRTIRDIFTSDIDVIYIDEPGAYERAKEFMQVVSPKYVDRLKLYDKPIPLFHNQNLEEEIDRIQRRTVPLPKGGSIVIDQTEALVAIDVNSGNFRADDNAEETAYQINLAAAKEIARQLRLRDLGGVIVNDFIDMREERHRRGIENALRDAVKRDRARTKILRMSAFGLIEMTRQRIRPSLKRSFYRECPTCEGTGLSKTVESMCIECMRLLTFIAQREDVARIDLVVDNELAGFLQNNKRRDLANIEVKSEVTINIIAKDMRSPEDFEITCYNDSGEPIKVDFGNSRASRR